MIWFVGAGCFHPDMLTVGAKKLLGKADCVLYDHLVNPEFLQYTSSSCEVICVGKRGHHLSCKQEDIDRLLLEKANQYKEVVRLKGGDPFLFGRGSEEMRYVLKHGYDCQYVPGISSAIGALGFAGIPVTQRHTVTGFTVHTLHRQDDRECLDYDRIAQDPNTQIFFMGSHKVEELVKGCLEAGMDEHTPIALGSHLTYPEQSVLCSTLKDVLKEDRRAYTSPLLIVLGDVVKEQPVLDNASRLPCFSKRVLCASIDDTPWPVDDLTLRYGIYSYVRKVADVQYDCEDVESCRMYSTLIFSSRHAVEGFLKALIQKNMDVRILMDKQIWCIGRKTEKALIQKGLWCDQVFTDYQTMFEDVTDEQQVCYIKGQGVQSTLPSLSCYQIREISFDLPDVRWDALCVTCPQSMRILVQKGISLQIPLFCFSHKSLQEARKLGFTNIHPCASSKKDLIEQMIHYFREAL